MEEMNTTPVEASKRPALLSVLCILTFIWSGLMTLLSLIGIFASGWIMDLAGGSFGSLGSAGGAILIVVFVIMLIFWGLSFWGALLMFKLRKGGFIMYVIPNGLMLIFQLIGIFSAFSFFNLLYLLVSIAFIVLYGMNLKFMK